eukprot:g6268.t1
MANEAGRAAGEAVHLLQPALEQKRRSDRIADGGRSGGYLSFGERERRAARQQARPEWLPTARVMLDARGKVRPMWDNADDHFAKVKACARTDAERRAAYAGAPAVASRERRRRRKQGRFPGAAKAKGGIDGEGERDGEGGDGGRPFIPEVSTTWSLPDPLPDSLEEWRVRARRRANAAPRGGDGAAAAGTSNERVGLAVLAAQVRARVGMTGVALLDEHQEQVREGATRDVEAIAELLWACDEPRTGYPLRAQCAARGAAIARALLSLEALTKEEWELSRNVAQLHAERSAIERRHEQCEQRARAPSAAEGPRDLVLAQRLGDDKYRQYRARLGAALKALRALVKRQRYALDGVEQLLHRPGASVEIDDVLDELQRSAEAAAAAEAAGAAQTDAAAGNGGHGGAAAVRHAEDAEAQARALRIGAAERRVLLLHFTPRPGAGADWRHVLAEVALCRPAIRQLAVDEAYGVMRAVVDAAYQRVDSAVAGAGELDAVAMFQAQVRVMYRRHLLRAGVSDGGGGNTDALGGVVLGAAATLGAAAGEDDALDELPDIAAHARPGRHEQRFFHLVEHWFHALPVPAPGKKLDFAQAVPRRNWNLYYAVQSDKLEEDGHFLSFMRRAWGLQLAGAGAVADVAGGGNGSKGTQQRETARADASIDADDDGDATDDEDGEVGLAPASLSETVRLARRTTRLWERSQRLAISLRLLERDRDRASAQLTSRTAELGALREASLSSRQLRVAPVALAKLTQLRVLGLDRNLLMEVPHEAAALPSLTQLSLDFNRIQHFPESTTALPAGGAPFGALRRLSMRANHFRGAALGPGVVALGSLTDLDLARNRLERLPAELANLTRLKSLNLEHNQLHGLPGSVLGRLTALTDLRLNDNDLSVLPDEVGQLRRLGTLTLHENEIKRLPRSMERLASLFTLTLHRNHLDMVTTDEGTEWPRMAGMAKLEQVTLDANHLSSLPRNLRCFRRVRRLDLSRNLFATLPRAAELAALQSCVELDLSHNRLRAPADLRALLRDAGQGLAARFL